MTKDELAFVLMKLTGFVVIVGAINIVLMAPTMIISSALKIGLGLLIIAKSSTILEFLFRFGEDRSATEEPKDEDTDDYP